MLRRLISKLLRKKSSNKFPVNIMECDIEYLGVAEAPLIPGWVLEICVELANGAITEDFDISQDAITERHKKYKADEFFDEPIGPLEKSEIRYTLSRRPNVIIHCYQNGFLIKRHGITLVLQSHEAEFIQKYLDNLENLREAFRKLNQLRIANA